MYCFPILKQCFSSVGRNIRPLQTLAVLICVLRLLQTLAVLICVLLWLNDEGIEQVLTSG